MSKYLKLQAPFKNAESLLKALADLGIQCGRAANLRQNDVTLQSHWKLHYGGQDTPVAIAVQREAWSRACLGERGTTYDGIGFAWNGQSYDLIQDDHDQRNYPQTEAKLKELRQRYAYHETNRVLRSKGLTLTQSSIDGKTINLTFAKR